jgi:hypothetical protein
MRSGRSATRWLMTGSLAAGAVGAALAIAGVHAALRLPLVLLFLTLAPALAVRIWLTGLDMGAQIVVAGTAAIVVNFAVAELLIVTGVWSERAGVAAVALLSLLIAISHFIFRQKAPATAAAAAETTRPR